MTVLTIGREPLKTRENRWIANKGQDYTPVKRTHNLLSVLVEDSISILAPRGLPIPSGRLKIYIDQNEMKTERECGPYSV